MRVFWYESTDLFNIMHPLDPQADGSAALTGEDFIFIGNKDKFHVYKYVGFESDSTLHNYPYYIVSTIYIDGSGYALYKRVTLSYTTGLYRIGDKYGEAARYLDIQTSYPKLGECVEHLFTKVDAGFSFMFDEDTYLLDTVYYDFDAGDSTDWTLLSGTAPVWTAGTVEAPSSVQSGTDYIYDRTFTVGIHPSANASGAFTFTNVLNNPRNLIKISYHNTTFQGYLSTAQMSSDFSSITDNVGTYTMSRAADAFNLGQQLKNIEPEDREYVVYGDPTYDTSKADNGYCEIVKINSDLSMTLEAVVDSPTATRNMNMGKFAALCYVDDTTYGTDLQLITTDVYNETIIVLSKGRSWAQVNSFAFDRNDTFSAINGHRNIFVVTWFDDSASVTKFNIYEWTGSSWSASASIQIAGTAYNPQFNICAGPGQCVIMCANQYIRLYNKSGTQIDSLSIPGAYYGCRVGTSTGAFWFAGWDSSPEDGVVVSTTGTSLTTEKYIAEHCDIDMAYDSTNDIFIRTAGSTSAIILELEQTGTFIVGDHKIVSNTDIFTFSSVQQITGGPNVVFNDTSPNVIWWQVSFDDGVTWKRWTSGNTWTTVLNTSTTTTDWRQLVEWDNAWDAVGLEADPGEYTSIRVTLWFQVVSALDISTSECYISQFGLEYGDSTQPVYQKRLNRISAAIYSETPDPNFRVYLYLTFSGISTFCQWAYLDELT